MLRDLAGAVWSVVVAGLAIAVGLAVVGDVEVHTTPVLVTALSLGFLVLEVVLSPLLRRLAALGSVVLAVGLGVTTQLTLLAAALVWAVGDTRLGWPGTLEVVMVAAIVLSLGRWLLGATDTAYVVGAATGRTNRLVGQRRRAMLRASGKETRGLLIVQLDGVSAPVLLRAIDGGQAPHLGRWLGTSHRLTPWWATVPSTTPASMAGFLHGDDQQVPAFRWWDRSEARLLSASRPADSRLVESRFTPGHGLLRDGGSAISTTYGGEADHAYLTISRAVNSRSLGSGATYVAFFARPFLLPGSLILTVGEMVKEVYQANRQKVRGVQPRISRTGSYVALRGITNVLLRRLNLSLVAQEMAAGRPIVFVDFVDYDEIAHHAGPERAEALRALEGLDSVLGMLREVAVSCRREYELVVVSDHGQSLGPTFAQVAGQSITDRVTALMDDLGITHVEQSSGEEWGPVNALVSSVLARWGTRSDHVVLGPDRTGRSQHRCRAGRPAPSPPVAARARGHRRWNLAMVWFPRLPARPVLGDIMRSWPHLVAGLVGTPGVGLVVVTADDGSPLVLGRPGARSLSTGEVDGDDPLAGYPERTAADLARLHALERSGDLVVVSAVDARGRVLAFEHQVGSHGGIGGPQNQALLVHPARWGIDPDLLTEVAGRPTLVGPVAVHRQLMAWRAGVGAGPRPHPDVDVDIDPDVDVKT